VGELVGRGIKIAARELPVTNRRHSTPEEMIRNSSFYPWADTNKKSPLLDIIAQRPTRFWVRQGVREVTMIQLISYGLRIAKTRKQRCPMTRLGGFTRNGDPHI